MTKHIKLPGVRSTKLFDAATVTRDQLVETAAKFHRGDTGLCDITVGLIQQVAELRGFAPITLVDLEPHRTHSWTVRAHDTKEQVWSDPPNSAMSSELIDYMSVHGQGKYVGLHYLGRRPEPVDVAKKIKEIGATSFR